MDDLIDRQAAIDALWKALYKYEDETEKKFQESSDLDLNQWMLHRIFIQNMNDIDRQTILLMPAVDAAEVVRCKDCENWTPGYITDNDDFIPPKCGKYNQFVGHSSDDFCSHGERKGR